MESGGALQHRSLIQRRLVAPLPTINAPSVGSASSAHPFPQLPKFSPLFSIPPLDVALPILAIINRLSFLSGYWSQSLERLNIVTTYCSLFPHAGTDKHSAGKRLGPPDLSASHAMNGA